MTSGKWPGESYEARIDRLSGASPEMFESKAGANPRCQCSEYVATGQCVKTRYQDAEGWPFPRVDAAGDEDDKEPRNAE